MSATQLYPPFEAQDLKYLSFRIPLARQAKPITSRIVIQPMISSPTTGLRHPPQLVGGAFVVTSQS